MKRAVVRLVVACVLFAPPALAETETSPRPPPVKVNPHDTHGLTLVALKVPDRGDRVKFTSEAPQAIVRIVGSAGYAVSTDESVLFRDAAASGGRFLLGGAMDKVSCTKYFDGRRCRARVTWELFDAKTKSIVYRVITSAFIDKHFGAEGDALWEENARSLLSRPRFAEALAKTKPNVPDGPPPPGAKVKRCEDKPPQLPKGADAAIAATVVVESGTSRGAGTVLSPDGVVLTAAHVLRAGDVRVVWKSGLSAKAIVVRVSAAQDLALLKAEANGLACVPIASTTPSTGDELYAVGAPLGLSFSVTRGILSGVREVEGRTLLQTDATVNAGNSGGPLLDVSGRLTAVVTTKLVGEGVEGIAFGVPVTAAQRALAIEPGDETSAILSQPVELPKTQQSLVVDDPDPLQLDARPDNLYGRPQDGAVRPSRQGQPSGATFAIGATLFGGGVATAFLGSSDGYKYVGGGVAAFGAGIMIVPFAVSPKASTGPTPRMLTYARRF